MIRAILILSIGVSVLICCLGASAQAIVSDAIISEGTGLTLSLVLGAICFVAWGAWQLAMYVMKQEVRIKALEDRIKNEADNDE